MKTTTITGTVTQPVVLGTGVYGNSLVIAATGAVAPSASGADAVTAPHGEGAMAISNRGALLGGTGAYSAVGVGGTGGDGILLLAAGEIRNSGVIAGGTGGAASGSGGGGAGGVGIDLGAYGTLANAGTVSGGGAGLNPYAYRAGSGGDAVDAQLGALIENRGLIEAGGGATAYYAGNGGVGVAFGHAGTLSNAGTILGGVAGYTSTYAGVGGDAVRLLAGGAVHNSGTIEGGSNGAAGLDVWKDAVVTNAGLIAGGAAGGLDSAGVRLHDGGTLVNGGTIWGDEASVLVDGNARLANSGTLIGAVRLEADGSQTLVNRGMIEGVAGLAVGDTGGEAAVVYGQSVYNSGVILGGAGGSATGAPGLDLGGAGGAGVFLQGGLLENQGTIAGGNAGSPGGGLAGGAGVYIRGGTLEAVSGTIAGGSPAYDAAGVLAYADAVMFSNSGPGTLLVDPGAVFLGAVAGNPDAEDVLALGGHGAGSLSGFGAAGGISGFASIVVESGADWTLSGTISKASGMTIDAHAALTLDGVAQGNVSFASGGNETLVLAAPSGFSGELQGFGAADAVVLDGVAASGFRFDAGVLALLNSAGGTVASLAFGGAVTARDFGLKTVTEGTEVYYRGNSVALPVADWHWGLSI